jgi:hypothetical protein
MNPLVFWVLCLLVAFLGPLAVARIRRDDDLLVIVRVDVALAASALFSVLGCLGAPVFLARAWYRSLLWSGRDVRTHVSELRDRNGEA